LNESGEEIGVSCAPPSTSSAFSPGVVVKRVLPNASTNTRKSGLGRKPTAPL
jgi:hypothetical protein